MPAVLVLGGYGLFGKRVCSLLLRHVACGVIVAGRSHAAATRFANALREQHPDASVHAMILDTHDAQFAARLKTSGAAILIHCAGPFQQQNYAVAEAALAADMHYIDLADGREFVQGISALDSAARAAKRCVISGASSVPALSSAVIAELAQGVLISEIDIGISPGNRTERGLATVSAILSYAGARIPAWQDGRAGHSHGWLALRRQQYAAPAGARWLVDCDVPDLALLPAHYPSLKNLRFGAGLELSILHLGLYGLALLRRARLLPNLARFAAPMKHMSEWFLPWGSDIGAMHVRINGTDADGAPCEKTWQLIAQMGDGPSVPAAASVALCREILRDGAIAHGARPAFQLLPLARYVSVLEGLQIKTFVQ
jgi:hypothetical protein